MSNKVDRLFQCGKGGKYGYFPGWWCSRHFTHNGPCALRPVWWNFKQKRRMHG